MSVNNHRSYAEGFKALRANLVQMLPAASLSVFDEDAGALSRSQSNILKRKAGDRAADFTLTNAVGQSVNLYEALKNHKIILVFYRGTWCPYCNLALAHYQSMLPEIEKNGGRLMAISPQTPDESLSISEKNNLEFEVLSDNGNLVARLYTTVFKNGSKPLAEMEKLGFNFDNYYADDSKEIPVPAVFIIHQDGKISYAKSEGGDFRNRTAAQEIIQALKK